MSNKVFKLLSVFSLLILFMSVSVGESAEMKVKVKVDKAKIRLEPSSATTVIANVPLGAVLDSDKKVGAWYRVTLPSGERGYTLLGYIHESQVEEVGEREETWEEVVPPEEEVTKRVPQEKVKEQEEMVPRIKKAPQQSRSKIYFAVGVGYGIPYGTLGINCEFNTLFPTEEKIFDYISLTAGFGYFKGGVKYAVGLRVYPRGRKIGWNPRISAYYGTVGFYKTYWGKHKNASGPAFGAGVLWMSKKSISVDVELQYRIPNIPSGYVKKEGVDLTLSAGIQYHF